MPSTVVVVRILAVSYNIICLATASLAQIEVCLAAIMGQLWQQVRDMETPPTPQNPLYVSLVDGWGPLKRWIDILMAPYTHTPVQAGPPLAALSLLRALRLGLGWYGQHNGVGNFAHHLKSLHACPKWMDNAFYGGGCPYFGCLIPYYLLGNGNFGSN